MLDVQDVLTWTRADILPLGWQYEDWNHDVPISSGLPSACSTLRVPSQVAQHRLTRFVSPATWLHVKRDLLQNRDPDYDSDEEGGWPFDQLSTFCAAAHSDRAA